MKRVFRTPSNLPDSIHRRLNMYALAAGAAGVGILALAPLAEAKIVYTRTRRTIGPNAHYKLDLNHDGIGDFRILNAYGCNFDYCYDYLSAIPVGRNGVVGNGGTEFTPHCAYALKSGSVIGPNQPFSGIWMARYPSQFCPWFNVSKRYLGLKFQVGGHIHYGWARLNVQLKGSKITAVLTGYAYETIPNKSIVAGKTKESELDAAVDRVTPTVSRDLLPKPTSLGVLALGSPVLSNTRIRRSSVGRQRAPNTASNVEDGNPASLTAAEPKPGTLGLLALGAPVLSIWRRDESVGVAR